MSIFSRKKIFTFKDSSGGSSLSGLTTNYLTKATSASTIGDSVVYESGGNVGIGTNTPMTVFDIECPVSNITNIDTVAQEQVSLYISQKYPETNA
jgi:hypothetical protein